MTTDDVAGALVPDNRFDVAEFLNGPLELLIFRIARLEVLALLI